MNYQEWEQEVPLEITNDPVWNSRAYRFTSFLSELAWHDATKLINDKRTISLADQLYRATGAISADIEEGYFRGSGKDRARFYEYALCSAREAGGWYYKGRHVLAPSVVEHRLRLFAEVLKLLLTTILDQRGHELREDSPSYTCSSLPLTHHDAGELFEHVPM